MSPLQWLRCPDNYKVPTSKCLSKCRLDNRCLTLPTLQLITKDRKWTGTPSTTQLLNGTMLEFLKITQPYMVDPQDRISMLLGIKFHSQLEDIAKELGLPAEIPLTEGNRDIFDLLEPDNGSWVLTDYKVWGSYRVAKALGIVVVGKQPDPSGAKYKTSGKWGKAGSPKMVNRFERLSEAVDLFEPELQLNNYRIKLEEMGIEINQMRLQLVVRDAGLAVAKSRGIELGGYLVPIRRLDDKEVKEYFLQKKILLKDCLEVGSCDFPCDDRECWEGARCRKYCEVSMYCPKGILYQEGGK